MKENAKVACAHRPGCHNKIPFPQGKHVGAHNAGEVHPRGDTNDQDDDADAPAERTAKDNDRLDIPPESFAQHDEQEKRRDGQHGLGDAH